VTVPVVLDASAAASWLIPSQATPAAAAFAALSAGRHLCAPPCFRAEIRGLIVKLERRAALAPHSADADLALLESRMDIERELGDASALAYWAAVMTIARRDRLSVFDAAYLELAQRSAAELASRDAGLVAAAQRAGVTVHDLR
jgi:predicted nucleic acid-binding protein